MYALFLSWVRVWVGVALGLAVAFGVNGASCNFYIDTGQLPVNRCVRVCVGNNYVGKYCGQTGTVGVNADYYGCGVVKLCVGVSAGAWDCSDQTYCGFSWTGSPSNWNGATIIVYTNSVQTPLPIVTNIWAAQVRNWDSVPHSFQVYSNGLPVVGTIVSVGPGNFQPWLFIQTNSASVANPFSIVDVSGTDVGFVVPVQWAGATNASQNPIPIGYGYVPPTFPGTYGGTNVPTPPIVDTNDVKYNWSAGSSSNSSSSLTGGTYMEGTAGQIAELEKLKSVMSQVASNTGQTPQTNIDYRGYLAAIQSNSTLTASQILASAKYGDTNVFGNVALATSLANLVSTLGSGAWLTSSVYGTATNYVGSMLTNFEQSGILGMSTQGINPPVFDENPLLLKLIDPSVSGVPAGWRDMCTMDLRATMLPDLLQRMFGLVRALIAWVLCVITFWALYEIISSTLAAVQLPGVQLMQNSGTGGASGLVVKALVREVKAALLMTLLIGLPTLISTCLVTLKGLWPGGSMSVTPASLLSSLVAGTSLEGPVQGWWGYVDMCFPWATLIVSITTVMATYFSADRLYNISLVFMKFMPCLILLGFAVEVSGVELNLQNGTLGPVGIISPSNGIFWFQPGYASLTVPGSNAWVLNLGTNPSIPLTFGGEVSDVQVSYGLTTNDLRVALVNRGGNVANFQLGLIVGLGFTTLAFVSLIVRRTLRMAFGGSVGGGEM